MLGSHESSGPHVVGAPGKRPLKGSQYSRGAGRPNATASRPQNDDVADLVGPRPVTRGHPVGMAFMVVTTCPPAPKNAKA
jgi:hypothetical protein